MLLNFWRRLLRVLWTIRKLSQSILKEINPEYSVEGLMLKLKFQYFGYLMQRVDLLGRLSPRGNVDPTLPDLFVFREEPKLQIFM